MERWSGRVALVTGVSSGIGAEIAKQLVKHGMKVVGCARRVENIEELANELKGEPGQLFPIKCNLENEEEIMSMIKWIKETLGGIDVCVNNAAIMEEITGLLDGTVRKWRQELNVNVVALCLCTREAVKSMRERGVDDGQIIHISSMAGHMVHPIDSFHFYSATKHMVQALTEGHRQEIKALGSHIRVVSVCPGYVVTASADRVIASTPEPILQAHRNCIPLQVQDIAQTVNYILSTPPHVEVRDIIVGNINM